MVEKPDTFDEYEAPALTEYGTVEERTRQIEISIVVFPS